MPVSWRKVSEESPGWSNLSVQVPSGCGAASEGVVDGGSAGTAGIAAGEPAVVGAAIVGGVVATGVVELGSDALEPEAPLAGAGLAPVGGTAGAVAALAAAGVGDAAGGPADGMAAPDRFASPHAVRSASSARCDRGEAFVAIHGAFHSNIADDDSFTTSDDKGSVCNNRSN